ncbi:hypothetical protein AJ85_12785 [Alkalihalobacillus alcalophilus ATCC 27647 = CGMCC 1.3604]|uniref:Uncharacterized protein n=1 Tax=Alkalihalobacillus alcalophilus ATCC 27647 = CGMCC 1.3604 TaxID=1218173 RepID=A0A094WSM3_ALKAL|nr:hypothetical protein [Alkalihalobacillus alcalophilus]KGA99078.1 hypothetical protein BALCAV_0200025 [Alkalihalobacillus alcalophilus ATCC 27647 = CGMCC 1.3604]MED1562534.1 hypothetical protein [Alkalihalobacillus alcalophilus]THG90111.1 hypothetical protein AJ85_12785 [Alkalihalobacillus alcalophilus ATCC 27647 = CGMCC 1.3604]
MKKRQIWFISVTCFIFIAVWTIAFIQFSNHEQTNTLPIDEETTLEVAQLDDREEEPSEVEINVVESSKQEEDEQPISVSSNGKVDLRMFDFSDISTPDGVPIDGILKKVGLSK